MTTDTRRQIPIYILVTLIIFASGAALTTLYHYDAYRTGVRNAVLALLLIYGFFGVMKLADHAELILLIIFSIFFVFINSLTYPETTTKVLYFFVKFILLYYFVDYCSKKKFDIGLIIFRIILILAVISLVIYFIINIFGIRYLPGGKLVGFDVFEERDTPFNFYYGLYIDKRRDDFVKNIMGRGVVRLAGPFWEPGIFGIYLSYALYYLLFKKIKKPILNFIEFIIIMIAIALTISTSAILCAGLILAVYLLQHRSQRTILIVFLLALIAILGALVVFRQKLGTSSGNARVKDIRVGMQIFSNNVLTGIGFENNKEFMSHWKNERNSSNGLITWIYSFGIVGIFVFFYPFIVNILNKNEKRQDEILFFIIFLIWNMTEPVTTMSFISLLFAMEYYKAFKSRNFTLELQGMYGRTSRKA